MTSFSIRTQHLLIGLVFIALINLNACSYSSQEVKTASLKQHSSEDRQQLDFYNTLASFCGQRFIGKSTFPTDPEDSFYDKILIATFVSCDEKEIRIPFSVGDNHSRTWIIRMTNKGLQLKHQHLHDDGTPDEVSNYGGYANADGSNRSQFFPADDFTADLIPAAATNVWNLELSEDYETLTYYLERHNKPRFKAVLKKSNIKL